MVTSLELLAQAKKHHRGKDLARAEVLCRQILEAEPANAEALHLLGVCAHFAGRHAEAVNNYQEALRHNPQQPAIVGNDLGVALAMQGHLDEAIAAFRHVLQLKPDDALCHNNLGSALCMQRLFEQAVIHFREALRFRPGSAEASNNLNSALRTLGLPVESAPMVQASPALVPGLDNLQQAERRIFSHNGEDGVLQQIFATIGATNKYFVEFGCEHATECNAAYLLEQGWKGLFMDGACSSQNPRAVVYKEFITAENINALFCKYAVPDAIDLLSIDIDGNDYWVWKAITYRPRVVVIEYNAHFPPQERKTIRYDPQFRWHGSDYFGASLQALKELGEQKGYTLVYCESNGGNAFFIATDSLPASFVPQPVEKIYRPPNYFNEGYGFAHDPDQTMIDPLDASVPAGS